MLWTIAIVLLVLWALGMLSAIGSMVHVLLVIALIVVLLNFIGGRKGD